MEFLFSFEVSCTKDSSDQTIYFIFVTSSLPSIVKYPLALTISEERKRGDDNRFHNISNAPHILQQM